MSEELNSPELLPLIRAGAVLAQKYEVERTLGVGGFGVVLAARHMQLDERVAIKLLLPEAAKNEEASARFVREAQAAVKIRSEHVCRVTDVGTLEPPGVPYMVMEYLDGADLSAIVKSRGAQPVSDVIEWVLQACDAIADAHSLGIVHRDLKPANLYLTHRRDGSPSVKVLDFGISKVASANAEDKGMTKTSDVMGSPYYMSPEQMRSTRNVDARTDIWALGTILFEMAGGRPPFDGETMPQLLAAILQEPPADLRQLRPDIHPNVLAIIQRCLEKDPARRYQTVGELAVALAPFAPARAQAMVGRIAGANAAQTHGAGTPISSAIGSASGPPPAQASQPGQSGPYAAQPYAAAQSGQQPQGAPHAHSGHQQAAHHAQSGHQQSGHQQSGHHAHSGHHAAQSGPYPAQPGAAGISGAVPPAAAQTGTGVGGVPQESWGSTVGPNQRKPNRLPLIIGLGSLAVGALAAAVVIAGPRLFGESGERSAATAAETDAETDAKNGETETAEAEGDVEPEAVAEDAPENDGAGGAEGDSPEEEVANAETGTATSTTTTATGPQGTSIGPKVPALNPNRPKLGDKIKKTQGGLFTSQD